MSGRGSVEIRRRLPAPPGHVFRWWTDPELISRWMSPVGLATASVDLRVGGRFRVVMAGEGMVIEHEGEFREIEPPHRLVFTWSSPYTGPTPSLVTVVLDPDGPSATQLHLVHSQLPESAAGPHAGGWGTMLGRLAEIVEQEESQWAST